MHDNSFFHHFAFHTGLGGPIGSGAQMMSWIHLQDMVRMIEFCVDNDDIEGAVNATAPAPVSNLGNPNKEICPSYLHVYMMHCIYHVYYTHRHAHAYPS